MIFVFCTLYQCPHSALLPQSNRESRRPHPAPRSGLTATGRKRRTDSRRGQTFRCPLPKAERSSAANRQPTSEQRRSHRVCSLGGTFHSFPSLSPPIAVRNSAFHLGNFLLLRRSKRQYRRQLPLLRPRSTPVCFAFSAPAARSAQTVHLQALAAPKIGCARPIACRLQRHRKHS